MHKIKHFSPIIKANQTQVTGNKYTINNNSTKNEFFYTF